MNIKKYLLNAVLFTFCISGFMPLLAQDSAEDVDEPLDKVDEE